MNRDAVFDELVETRSTSLVKTAYLLTGDWGHAEDLLQTALTKTYLRWHRLRDPGAAEAYVRKVMFSTYAKWYRRRWRGEHPAAAVPDVGSSDPYPAIDERDALRRALAALPARQRAVLVLRYYHDLTEPQVAETLGCSLGTVKSATSRGLERLRTHSELHPTVEERTA